MRYWLHRIKEKPNANKYLLIEDVRKAAREGLWEEKRNIFWDAVKSAWLRQSHDELLAEQASMLRDAQEIRDGIFQAIRPRINEHDEMVLPIAPRSYEGMVGAYIKLEDKMDERRELIKKAIEPMLKEATKPRAEESKFSSDEMRAVAHSILKQRRKQRHLEMGIEDPRDDDDYESLIEEQYDAEDDDRDDDRDDEAKGIPEYIEGEAVAVE